MDAFEFASRMNVIWNAYGHNPKTFHLKAADLMGELLEDLGFGDGVAIFRNAERWYEGDERE